jgi:hypothetical protein
MSCAQYNTKIIKHIHSFIEAEMRKSLLAVTSDNSLKLLGVVVVYPIEG